MLNEQLEFDLGDQWSLNADNDNRPPLNKWEAKWRQFHAENPGVYELVKRFAYEAIAKDRNHYSIMTVIQRIRWHTEIETTGDTFKINNNFAPYYARLFHADHPKHDGFFKTRMLTSSGGNA